MKAFTFDECYFGQSKGCWLEVQIGYWRMLWHPSWADKRECAKVRLQLFAPKFDEAHGRYRCNRFRFRVKP